MTSTPYTLAKWKVRPGMESAFIAAWEQLGGAFSRLAAPPLWGTLLQGDTDPSLFYSFGPWQRLEDIAVMRSDTNAQRALQVVRDLCVEATPGTYRVVRHIAVERAEMNNREHS